MKICKECNFKERKYPSGKIIPRHSFDCKQERPKRITYKKLRKMPFDEFLKQLREWQKDPKFRKEVKKFIIKHTKKGDYK